MIFKFRKQIISVILAFTLVISMMTVGMVSASALVDEDGYFVPSAGEQTNRYYFYMPDEWYSSSPDTATDTAGAYWISDVLDFGSYEVSWPGYKAHKDESVDNLFYTDCPKAAFALIWNNYLDGGLDVDAPIYTAAVSTLGDNIEFCSREDNELYPDSLFDYLEAQYSKNNDEAFGNYKSNFFFDTEYGYGFSFDYNNMVYVIDPSETDVDVDGSRFYDGNFFFYYGDSTYGNYPTKKDAMTRTDGIVGEFGKPFDRNANYYQPSSKDIPLNTYYLYMPDEWNSSAIDTFTDTAGIYWWDGSDANMDWPGYKAFEDEYRNNLFYSQCPKDATTIIWNNYLNSGNNVDELIYKTACQTVNINVDLCCKGDDEEVYSDEFFEYMEKAYNEGKNSKFGDYKDNFSYDEEYGLGFSFNFDNMVYVIDPSKTSENFAGMLTYGGEWYFYYGDGTYGNYPTKSDAKTRPDGIYKKFVENNVKDEDGHYNPKDDEVLNRYYFYMPDEWYSSSPDTFTDTAGIYWWDQSPISDGSFVDWPGFKTYKDESIPNLFYADCPENVATIVWNNYLDGGINTDEPIYKAACQSTDAMVEFYSDGDSDIYSTEFFNYFENAYDDGNDTVFGDFKDNFFYDEDYGFSFELDNMVYVIDPSKTSENFAGRLTYGGEWYFYYGDGTYGNYPTKLDSQTKPDGVYGEFAKAVIGDVDGNGVCTISDATLIQKYVAELETLDESQVAKADLNNDGEVNVLDVTLIQKIIAKLV